MKTLTEMGFEVDGAFFTAHNLREPFITDWTPDSGNPGCEHAHLICHPDVYHSTAMAYFQSMSRCGSEMDEQPIIEVALQLMITGIDRELDENGKRKETAA